MKYRITRGLRKTPHYEVFEATDADRIVAVKRLTPEAKKDEVTARNFVEEAKVARRFHHDNILGVLEYGRMEGEPFQVLQQFEARDLAAIKQKAGNVPLAASLYLARELAQALAYAHRAGVVHRAISPASVLIAASGEVKLTDFILGSGTIEERNFTAPELNLDQRSDLHALGMLLKWLGAENGDSAFRAKNAEEMAENCAKLLSARIGTSDPKDWMASWLRSTVPSPPVMAPTLPRAPPKPRIDDADTSREQVIARSNTRVGADVAGRYKILEPIGHGGMGTVYRAVQLTVGREVALKTLLSSAEGELGDLLQRFENEARIISQLRHPNTLRLFDFGRMGEDELFIVTELLAGQTLEDRILEEPLDAHTLIHFLIDVADALSEAHTKNIIHRDIKPRNLFLDRVGDREIIKILDFGLAKLTGLPTRTAVGLVVGSPTYMAPEQARGDEVTPKSDLYSLGVTAYECLAGEPPFDAANAASMLLKHLHDPPPRFAERNPPVRVPPAVEEIVFQLLAKDAADRPPSAAALRDRLREIERDLVREPGLEKGSASSEGQKAPSRPPSGTNPIDPLLDTLIHNYRVKELLGSGQAAKVYRATHQVLNRDYALKVLTDLGLKHDSVIKRLRREAEALSRIDHPHVVKVVDFGVTGEAFPYLVMEFLKGRTLKREIQQEGPLTPTRAARITSQVASALAVAHAQGLVHRDLKTSNLMLLDDHDHDDVKVLDFGLARMIDPEGQRTALTRKDAILGSPSYMAPEQIANASTAGPEADLYSLGCIVYAMLSGRPPFTGPVMDILEQQRSRRPPPLPASGGLERLAMWLLEKRPADRPKDAATVVAEVERLGFEAKPKKATPPPPPIPDAFSDESLTPISLTPSAPATTAAPTRPMIAPFTPPVIAPPPSIRPVEKRSSAPMIAAVGLAAVVGGAAVFLALRKDQPIQDPGPIEATPVAVPRVTAETPQKIFPEEPVAAAKTPPKKKPAPAEPPKVQVNLQTIEGRFFQSMSERGLSFDDLESTALATSLEDWREARKAGDLPRAEAALQQLIAGLDAVPVDARLIKRKLDRVSRRLQVVAEKLDPSQVKDLEQRYFELVSRVSPSAKPADLTALSVEITALERAINGAAKAY